MEEESYSQGESDSGHSARSQSEMSDNLLGIEQRPKMTTRASERKHKTEHQARTRKRQRNN